MANNARKDEMLMPSFGVTTGTGSPPNTPVDLIWLVFSFLTNGASNPVAASNRGHPISVVRTSAGLYTIQLGGPLPIKGNGGAYGVRQVVGFFPVLGKGAAGSALRAAPGTIVDASGTLQVRLEDATGAATDLAAGADNRVNCLVAAFNGGR
jgi:hypothetical protein